MPRLCRRSQSGLLFPRGLYPLTNTHPQPLAISFYECRFSRVYLLGHEVFVILWLTWHGTLQVHPCCCKRQGNLPSYRWQHSIAHTAFPLVVRPPMDSCLGWLYVSATVTVLQPARECGDLTEMWLQSLRTHVQKRDYCSYSLCLLRTLYPVPQWLHKRIPTNSAPEFSAPYPGHTRSCLWWQAFCSRCEVIFPCHFVSHFPNDQWYRTPFHLLKQKLVILYRT